MSGFLYKSFAFFVWLGQPLANYLFSLANPWPTTFLSWPTLGQPSFYLGQPLAKSFALVTYYAIMLMIACNDFMTCQKHIIVFFYACRNSSISCLSSSVKTTSQQFSSVSRIRIFGIFDMTADISETSAACSP